MIKIVGQDLARYTTHITCLADCMLQQILCILSSKESSGYPITSSTPNKDLWLVIRWASSGPFDFGSNETGICECLLTMEQERDFWTVEALFTHHWCPDTRLQSRLMRFHSSNAHHLISGMIFTNEMLIFCLLGLNFNGRLRNRLFQQNYYLLFSGCCYSVWE